MGERFLGKTLSPALIDELEALGIDPCGENGEYHTLVQNCPLFTRRLDVKINEKYLHDHYWFCTLTLEE
jgi:diphthamide synthase (EF-2-diphthine--ammonia ligase)